MIKLKRFTATKAEVMQKWHELGTQRAVAEFYGVNASTINKKIRHGDNPVKKKKEKSKDLCTFPGCTNKKEGRFLCYFHFKNPGYNDPGEYCKVNINV